MPGIFISYRRSDNPDAMGRIYDRLVSEFGKARVFKDVDSIPLGQDFRGHLNDIVGGCAAVLAIIGPKWTDIRNEAGQRRLEDPDDFVRIELEAALSRRDFRWCRCWSDTRRCQGLPIAVDSFVSGVSTVDRGAAGPGLSQRCDTTGVRTARNHRSQRSTGGTAGREAYEILVTVAGWARRDGHVGGCSICDTGGETPPRSAADGVPHRNRYASRHRSHVRPVRGWQGDRLCGEGR